MAWLVGIIVLILCFVFWRAALVILGIGAILIFLLVQNDARQGEERARQRTAAAERSRAVIAAARQRVQDAQENLEPREWQVTTETDPASGLAVPRRALVESDDGLCTMTVEERIDRTRLTGFNCPGLDIRTRNDIDVKFDNRDRSDRMEIREFLVGGRSAYIPSREHLGRSGRMEYDDFLNRLGSTNKVAIQFDFTYAGEQWVTFSLNGSREALTAIGAL